MTFIVPLFDARAAADEWHRVTAPGGYEWWHFDAFDRAADLRVTVNFFDGFPLDPAYRHSYAAYRRHPTRQAPPLPSEFARACLSAFEGTHALMQKSLPGPVSGDADGIQIATASLRRADHGWRVSIAGTEIHFLPLGQGWRVEGTLALPEGSRPFRGFGHRDQQHATEPLSAGRRLRLRIDQGERTMVYHAGGEETISFGRLSRRPDCPAYPELIRCAGYVFKEPVVLSYGRQFAEIAYRAADATAMVHLIDLR